MTYLYQQMNDQEINSFLYEPRHGVLGTTSWFDERPQLNTVWWIYEQGRIWFSFFHWSNKLKNIQTDPHVCLCIPTAFGDGDRQVIIYGEVDRIDKQGEPGYDATLDYRITQRFSISEEEALITHEMDLRDGPWMQVSFKPLRILGDNYDTG